MPCALFASHRTQAVHRPDWAPHMVWTYSWMSCSQRLSADGRASTTVSRRFKFSKRDPGRNRAEAPPVRPKGGGPVVRNGRESVCASQDTCPEHGRAGGPRQLHPRCEPSIFGRNQALDGDVATRRPRAPSATGPECSRPTKLETCRPHIADERFPEAHRRRGPRRPLRVRGGAWPDRVPPVSGARAASSHT